MALMPVADALAAILAGAEPMGEEMIALEAAYHRVLARDIAARRTQPPQAMSAMDGYAVRAADAAQVKTRLKVIGEVAAGRPFDRGIGKGEAARIFTGGVLPEGADAVVIQEDTIVDGNGITITEAAATGRHIRPAGVDFREGDVLLSGGSRLTDRDLALAASMNYPELPVRRRPKVALLATGDELVLPGSTPGPGQIVYSNGYALRALARARAPNRRSRGGRRPVDVTIAGIRRAREAGADILVTTGGASVGDHDLVQPGACGRKHDPRLLEDRDASGETDDARPPRRHARARRARQSCVVLCLYVLVSGPIDSRFVRPQDASPRARDGPARP